MPQFKGFKKKHGPATQCRPSSLQTVAAYQKKLPAPIIAEWQDSGWCAYGNGFIWLVDPDMLTVSVGEWLGPSSSAVPFARSAFGHLFLWDDAGAQMLDPQHGTLAKIVNKIEIVFDYVLCRKEYLEDVLDKKLFVEARKKLGPLEFDECYGFEPAIALGGPGTIDTLRRVKLREHLSILAQLVDEVRQV